MRIDNVQNNVQVYNHGRNSKVSADKTPKQLDKLEISAEAKSKIREANRSRIDAIRADIEAGKYDSDDVIGKVVDFIVKDIS